MFHYSNSIQNKQGDALPGYFVQVVNPATGLVAPIYSDKSSTPIITVSGVANMALVDANGMVSFYITDGNYNVNVYAQDATTLKGNYLDVPMVGALSLAIGTVSMLSAGAAPTASIDSSTSPAKLNLGLPTTTGPAGAAGTPGANSGTGATAVSRAAMAAIVSPSSLAPLFLTEAGREGLFAFSTANLSAYVTADPQQGIYVPPTADTTGASGAWVRKSNGQYDIRWFGGLADCTAVGVGTDNSPALNAAITLSKTTGLRQIMIPTGKWRFSSRIALTQGVQIFGDGFHENPGIAGGITYSGINSFDGTICVFDANVGGFIGYAFTDNPSVLAVVASLNANGLASPEYKYKGAAGWCVSNLMLYGGGGTAVGAHGIETRTVGIFDNVRCDYFAGSGFVVEAETVGATGDTPYGNADGSVFYRCRSRFNKMHGFRIRGNDANVLSFIGCDAAYSGGVGFLDNGQLGNQYTECHAASNNQSAGTFGQTINSITFAGTTATVTTAASHGLATGYIVTVNQAAPSQYNVSDVSITVTGTTTFTYTMGGTPATNATTVGNYLYAPTLTTQRTQCKTDAPWLSDPYAGAYGTSSAVWTGQFIGCYTESGQGTKSQILTPAQVIGGNLANANQLTAASTVQANFNGNGVVALTEIDAGISGTGVLTLVAAQVTHSQPTGTIVFRMNPQAGTYSNLQMYGAGSAANGLDIITGSGSAYFSSGYFQFRNAAQSVNWTSVDNTGVNIQTGALKVAGTQVVSTRQTGTAANATDLASALTLVNDLKTKLIAHGLIS